MQNQRSRQPRKQRKSLHQAPLHQRHKKLAAHLAEPLLVKYNRRSLPVVKGDTVRVMRGAYTGHEEKVASVDLTMMKVTVEGVTNMKADGTRVARPVDASNLLITKLNLTDARRRERLTRTAKVDDDQRKQLEKELEEEAKAQAEEIEEFKERLAREEAERKAQAREEGDAEAAIDPVTQEPIVHRHRAEMTEEEIAAEEDEAAADDEAADKSEAADEDEDDADEGGSAPPGTAQADKQPKEPKPSTSEGEAKKPAHKKGAAKEDDKQ